MELSLLWSRDFISHDNCSHLSTIATTPNDLTMPSTSSGRIVKTSKGKRGTTHSKNHKWESFTVKIAKLNSLDPLRRVRRHDLETGDLSTTTSYLRSGLERWQELNLSDDFLNFLEEVLPYCDSLPQILHFEDKIMDMLVSHIEKEERESLEPLLSLLTDFAHDLGTRFEKHYARALVMVTALAAKPQDVAVIEWTFSCLAFMFKYLSKLLAPDLRPTYDIMAPLLGRHRQKPHIARFAAEAMSFLIKKAGAPAHRAKALKMIVQHAKKDLHTMCETKEYGLYYHGLMTLFAEAIKGTGLNIHSSGPAIFESLLVETNVEDFVKSSDPTWMDVVCGVLTSLVHHSSSDTFHVIVSVVVDHAASSIAAVEKSADPLAIHHLMLAARTIGIITGVRKGTRIANWPSLSGTMAQILRTFSKNDQALASESSREALWQLVVLSAAVTLQYAPMDAIIPFISIYMDVLTKDPFTPLFLNFCSYFSDVDQQRFSTIVQSYFQR